MRPPRARSRLRYAFDDDNRLVIRERRALAERAQPVRIIEGTVTTDGGNRLVYRTQTPTETFRSGPRAITLDGTWALTPAHDLALTLHETDARDRQTLYLKGALIRAEAHALVFALRRQDGRADPSQAVALSGRWQADARNRLTFLVEKADGSEERLTLGGGWEVGPHHGLWYRYRRPAERRGLGGEEHTLVFAGAWELAAADRLVYRLEGSTDSAFEFRASLQRPSLNAREGRLVYQVGIGLSRGRTQQQRVVLFGAWKLHRDLAVSFEVPYAGGRVRALRFEGTYALTSRDRIAVALWGPRGEPLGLTVTFTRDLVPDASLFVRARRDERERSLIGGVQVRF